MNTNALLLQHKDKALFAKVMNIDDGLALSLIKKFEKNEKIDCDRTFNLFTIRLCI